MRGVTSRYGPSANKRETPDHCAHSPRSSERATIVSTAIEELLELEADVHQECADSADFLEAVTSSIQKRQPQFTGR